VITQQNGERLSLGPHYSVDEWADKLAASETGWDDRPDLLAVQVASDAVRLDDLRLLHSIARARESGRTWHQVSMAVGMSVRTVRRRYEPLLPMLPRT
jgi:hypothetical protein